MESLDVKEIRSKPFVERLYHIVNAKETDRLIHWDGSDGFEVPSGHADEFSERVLPLLCNSRSLCSLIRQLNSYGFSKADPQKIVFRHEKFRRDHPELLSHIQRRKATKRRAQQSSSRPFNNGKSARQPETSSSLEASARESGDRGSAPSRETLARGLRDAVLCLRDMLLQLMLLRDAFSDESPHMSSLTAMVRSLAQFVGQQAALLESMPNSSEVVAVCRRVGNGVVSINSRTGFDPVLRAIEFLLRTLEPMASAGTSVSAQSPAPSEGNGSPSVPTVRKPPSRMELAPRASKQGATFEEDVFAPQAPSEHGPELDGPPARRARTADADFTCDKAISPPAVAFEPGSTGGHAATAAEATPPVLSDEDDSGSNNWRDLFDELPLAYDGAISGDQRDHFLGDTHGGGLFDDDADGIGGELSALDDLHLECPAAGELPPGATRAGCTPKGGDFLCPPP